MESQTTRRALFTAGAASAAMAAFPAGGSGPLAGASYLAPLVEKCFAHRRWIDAHPEGLADKDLDIALDRMHELDSAVLDAPIINPADIGPKLQLILHFEREGLDYRNTDGERLTECALRQVIEHLGMSTAPYSTG